MQQSWVGSAYDKTESEWLDPERAHSYRPQSYGGTSIIHGTHGMRCGCAKPWQWALLLLGGCVWTGDAPHSESLETLRPVTGPQGSDAVGLEVAVLEVSVGDRYANSGLWATLDEQVIPLDRKSLLDDNGFRVALISGMRPDRFDDLLKSPRTNPDPHWIQMRAGNTKVLTLGPSRAVCQFRITNDGKAGPIVAFENAQCGVQIVPSLAADGRIQMAFVPIVQHGLRPLWPTAANAADLQRPAERYSDLGWELTLTNGEFVLIGANFEKKESLGFATFVDPDAIRPIQRLLAIRAARPADR